MSDILTEDQLRAALTAGENEDLVAIVPDKIAYCEQCDRYFDSRCGCETDIRFDERSKIRAALLADLESITVSTVWPDDHGPGVKVEPFVLACDLRDCIDRILPERNESADNEFPMITDDHNSTDYLTQANDTQP